MGQLSFANFEKISNEISIIPTDTLLFIIDYTVNEIYNNQLSALDNIENKKIIKLIVGPGENAKNFKEYEKAIEHFLERGVHRNAHLIAIGGGATIDFGGFIAATLLRGISWSAVPTTMISMIDAGIGGKTAINSKSGKNLIGAFHKPIRIWIDTSFLETMERRELQASRGELIKTALLDKNIYDMCLANTPMEDLIKACAEYKLHITEKDFLESGRRKILNLGHTIGHALEIRYRLRHGEAVLWGMATILKVFECHDALKSISFLKKIFAWPIQFAPWIPGDFPVEKMISYISKDKKVCSKDHIQLVLVKEIGIPLIETFSTEELEAKLIANQEALNELAI